MNIDVLDNFQEITIESPVDKIIRQVRELITSGQLNPGDKLPPERRLAERLGVGRSNVRDAIKKLEFYGILKTLPQSGTVVAGMGLPALEGLITDMLSLHNNDFKSLVETRVILETNLAQLAAQNRTDKDLIEIENALNTHRKKIELNEDGSGLFTDEEGAGAVTWTSDDVAVTLDFSAIGGKLQSSFVSFVFNPETGQQEEVIFSRVIDRVVIETTGTVF